MPESPESLHLGGPDPPDGPSAETSRTNSTKRPIGWRLAAPLAALAAGLLFIASAQAARGTDLRGGRATTLADLIGDTEQQNAQVADEVSELRTEIEALTATSANDQVEQARSDADALAPQAGLTEVAGPAVRVTLDDAPPGALGLDYPGLPGPSPDDIVVHQQDLQAVVNALWAGGALAIELMDQRVITTSAVRCVGNTLILHGRVYSPPYTVTAVGDMDRLVEALDASPAIAKYRQYVDAYGLGYQVEKRSTATVPAYTGALDLRYAKTSRE